MYIYLININLPLSIVMCVLERRVQCYRSISSNSAENVHPSNGESNKQERVC